MSKLRNALIACTVLLVGSAFLVGCAKQYSPTSNDQSQNVGDWKSGLDEDVIAGLSKLSDEDRSAAISQKACPVSGKALGSMGKPLKVNVEGQDVFLCCGGCEDELKNDPAKYLAKLKTN